MAEELRFPSSPSQRIFLVMVLPMRPLSRILLGDEWDFIFQESLWMYVHACVCVYVCVFGSYHPPASLSASFFRYVKDID